MENTEQEQQEDRSLRAIGTTTRVVDRIIQEFFTNGHAYVYERINGEYHSKANEEVLKRFELRLITEHPRVTYETKRVEEDGIKCFKVSRLF